MSFTKSMISECIAVLNNIEIKDIDSIAGILDSVRTNSGRLFIIGSGGGAGHASHAVCDFRKLCNIEAYAPYDNVSEMTARINDEGFETSIENWLKVSKLNSGDCVFVFSVGGGNEEKKISGNIVRAVKLAKSRNAKIVGIVGKDGGFTKKIGDAVLVIPTVNVNHITPVTEGLQSLIWHILVSHPKLQVNPAKWESVI